MFQWNQGICIGQVFPSTRHAQNECGNEMILGEMNFALSMMICT